MMRGYDPNYARNRKAMLASLPGNEGGAGLAPVADSGLSNKVGISASLKPAFDVDKQRAMLDRVFGMQSDQLRTQAADQAEGLALRSGMSVNGGQAMQAQNEILAPQMAQLQLARLQAELGLDRDAAEFQMRQEQAAEERRRWQAEHDMAKQQYEDQQETIHDRALRAVGGGRPQALSYGGAPAPRPLGGGMGGGMGAPGRVIGGSPGFSPDEMPDGGQLLSKTRPQKAPDRAFPSDRPSSIRPPASTLDARQIGQGISAAGMDYGAARNNISGTPNRMVQGG